MKKMVKLVLMALMSALVFSAVTAGSALAGTQTGPCGDKTEWEYNPEEHLLVIKGEGPVDDYDYNWFYNLTRDPYSQAPPWKGVLTEIETLRVEDGVTEIGDYAFQGAEKLKTIELGKSVTRLGMSCFDSCGMLESVNFPESLKGIDVGCFRNSNALRDVTFPEGLVRIDGGAFYGSGLQRVILPSSLKVLGQNAFCECSELEEIIVQDGLTVIDDYAFCRCPMIKKIVIPPSVTKFGKYVISQFNGIMYGEKDSEAYTYYIQKLTATGNSSYVQIVYANFNPAEEGFTVPDGFKLSSGSQVEAQNKEIGLWDGFMKLMAYSR